MKHGPDRSLICPTCLKTFESKQAVKAHQKMKRHTQFIKVDEPWAKYAKDNLSFFGRK